ncbi:MAG TPA: rRNA maturation RNase YbeY [Tepidisphaeraceae bacterium]|nr:rRNA maturation RNase YbeY [Tepidisphaeraceae bacterium]
MDLALRADAGKQYVPYLKRYLHRVPAMVRSPLQELSVALVGDARMSQLHVQFMHIDGPTDVLTFPLDTDNRGRVISGEIVICVPEARRQARQHRVSVERELLLYAIHGILHLNGFDDRTDADYRRMHRTEDRILTDLGIGATFMPAELNATKAPKRARGGSCC